MARLSVFFQFFSPATTLLRLAGWRIGVGRIFFLWAFSGVCVNRVEEMRWISDE